MDVNSDTSEWLSADQIVALSIPGYPRSVRRIHDRAETDGWETRQIPSQGRTGYKRVYRLPDSVVALVRQAKLRSAFEAYREQVAAGEPLTTAKASFLNDYNAGAATVNRVGGVSLLTLEQLDDALSAPRQGVIQHTVGSGKTGAMVGVIRAAPQGGEEAAGVPVQAAPMMVPADTTEMVTRCLAAAARVMQGRFTPEQHVSFGIDTWGALRRMFYGREAENIGNITDADLDLLAQFIFNTKRLLNPGAK